MTSNFDARKHSTQEAAREMDSLQRDRFELLSAYIDGEVTAAERSQVQELLANNSDMQRLYARLLKLRQELQKMPVPPIEQSAQAQVQAVFSRIDRRRTRKTMIWGGAAIAAVFVSALSGILPGSRSLVPQLAQAPEQEAAQEPLMIAVNQPLIEIPKAPVASSVKFLKESPTERPEVKKNFFN